MWPDFEDSFMRLSPWLAPLTDPRTCLADKVVRRTVSRRRRVNGLSQMTERLEARTLLTSFTVDSFFDTVDDNPGDASALDATGRTSLRAAIMEANASAGSDTITLGGGIFNLSIEGTDEDAALTGDLDIIDDLVIQGQSAQTTIIDARSLDRVFEVLPGVTLQLFNLTITGGDLAGRGDGGGIRVDGGMLQLGNVIVTDNRASSGGGIHNNLGTVTVIDSTFVGNRAEGMFGFGQGGAIDSIGGTVIVQQSTFNDNFAQSAGGGISSSADTLGGALSIENSTIAQNTAGDSFSMQGDGGGLYIQANVNATVFASTVAFNMAGNQGGGAWVNGSLMLGRSIVSDNLAGVAGPEGFVSSGSVNSNGFNLVRDDSNFPMTPGTGDQIGTFTSPINPNLLGLTDNGGPTQTIALGGMSPAIDAGPLDPSPLFADQRGFTRDRDGDRNGSMITDIGAFEVQSPSDYFVDDIGGGTIISGFAGDFQVVVDGDGVTGGGGGTANGILDFGDIVTFDPGGQPIFNVEFGVRAFGNIDDALTAVRGGDDFLSEVVLGAGTYTGSVMLDIFGMTLRGHTGNLNDVVINGGGASTGISVTEDSVSLSSLRVTNAMTGVDVAPFSSAQFFDADNIRIDGTTVGLQVFDSIGFMDVSIQNSTITGNSGDGIRITNVGTAQLRNVSSTLNGQDGVEVVSTPIVGFDTVTVDQNSNRGLVVDGADTIAVMDPRTSASTNGNVFSNSSVLLFSGVAGDVANSTTVTATEIKFDAGSGATQEDITISNITTLFVAGDGGNDSLAIDYSAGNPSPSRQLFLNGGEGNDTIVSPNDANQKLTDARLTIGGIDEVAIANFEQATLVGGIGNNNLDAIEFDGPVTLSGLAGNDTLRGSSSNDVLDGGGGDDILEGGPLHEQYVVGGAVFESLDLADSDTNVVTILDETDTETATILLDSDMFRFNDVTYAGNSLFVAPSGVASLGGPISPQNNFDLTDAPNTVGGIPIIAPLFDDWVTGITSPPGLTLPDAKVLYKFEDTNADFINDRLIIEWNEVYHRDQIDTLSTPFLKAGASPVTFQLILELNTFDRDGDVTFNYVDLDTGTPFSAIADGASATVGGRDGAEHSNGVQQISFNSPNPLVTGNKAIVARSAESDGDDILTGGTGDDILFSNSGADSIDGGAGANDRFIFGGFNNDLASDHTINSSAVESTVFQTPDRSIDFKASYSNIEALDIGFGPADQNVLVELSGLPASVTLDTRGPSASDSVTVNGTAGIDALALSGTTLTDGTTTIDLSGVENLTLDISSGGADTISVDQDFTGSARSVVVKGDLSDDTVSLQSTTKQQQINIFSEVDYFTQLREVLGGEIVLEEVLSNGGEDGSENTITNQQAPDQVIVSPDGTRVYVAASDSDALVVYGRDRVTGDLTFIESLANLGMDAFGNTITGLDGASNVIVSADGRYVYVASEFDRTIALFVRHEGDNQLTFISSTVLDVAGNPVNVDLPSGMAFIPDGSVLIVTSETGNRIDFFEVDGAGDLVFQGSLVDGGQDSGMTTIDGLAGASSVAVSPDGRHMYVTGATDNAIAVFSEPTEEPEMSGLALPLFIQKLANLDMDASLNVVTGLGGASSVEVSPDGMHVYVTGETDDSIAVFSRDSNTGELTFGESLTDSGLDSMSNTVENLLVPVSVSISPEGTTVYVAASGSDAVTVFDRDFSSGALTFAESLASGDTDGAGTTIAGVISVSSVFASVDGQHVYASGTGDDAIVRFNVPRLLDVSTDGEAALSITTSDADDTFSFGLAAQPANVAIDAGGSVDNDSVVIQGTSFDDTVSVDGGTVTSGTSTFSLANVEGLNIFLDDGDDTVNVTASASGPAFFNVDGNTQSSGDVLNVDAQTAQVIESGSNISFTGGLNVVSYGDFETVAITNATPTIDDGAFVVAENAPVSSSVGTPVASDPEAGESLVWSISSGNTGDAFSINASTGEITVNAELDFEIRNTYGLVIEVEDNQTLKDTATITINVTDVKPMISNQTFAVDENASNGESVGTVALAPGDQNSVTFGITAGNFEGEFSINSSSGEITVANAEAIDFEQLSSFDLTVEVTDDAGATVDSATVTIDINDLSPAISDQSFAVGENASDGTSLGTVSLDFGDENSLDFGIDAGNTGNAFAIDSFSGEITVNDTSSIDFEASPSFELIVVVSDEEGSSSATVTINVSDVEPAIFDQSFSVTENLPNGTPVGTVLLDPGDENSIEYSITAGNTSGAFAINASTGAITVADTTSVDFEAASLFALTVIVSDDGGTTTDAATVTVNINDVNEAPVLDPIGNRVAIVDAELAFTVTATDPDSPSAMLTFSLGVGAPVGASVTPGGNFTFTPTSALDGMALPITIIVTEGNEAALTASETVTISVTSIELDFGDAPTVSQTLLVNDGPRHIIGGGLFLGSAVDAEVNGQPEAAALGDDANGPGRDVIVDDEDGITFLSALNVGATRQFRVKTSGVGKLDAWIDFNRDGTFSASEKLVGASGLSVPAGFSTVSFNIPNSASPGQTFARFRLSGTGGLSPTGLASDGEVEDYRVVINEAPVEISNSIEPALSTAVDGFFDAFPDELNDPDPNITGDELPLAVQAENGATAERRNGAPPLNQTDPALRTVVRAINAAVARLEEDRGADENILVVATHPVDFLLTDTQGRSVGFTQAAGTVNEIGADATFTGDGVVELLTIRNADPGEYGLQLVGVGGVFRGGASLITPAGTQEVTFQGSLADSDEVQLALTYQEGLASFPTRTDLATVDFSEIADLVAQIPTAENDANTLAAGVTEALASIAMARLDGSLFSRIDDPGAAFERLLERISKARKKLLEAIETSLDEDDLKGLKLVFGDDAEDEDNVEVLARVLMESVSGPLISAPRQVKELSQTLQQLLDQLKEQQKQQGNQPVPTSNGSKGAAKPEAEDKRTSQNSSTGKPVTVANSSFVVSADDVAKNRGVKQTTGLQNSKADSGTTREPVRRPKFIARTGASAQENASAEASSDARDDRSIE